MEYLGISIQVVAVLFIMMVGSYDWFYANRIHKVENQLKIILPGHLHTLLSLTKTISFGAAGVMILLMLLTQHFFFR